MADFLRSFALKAQVTIYVHAMGFNSEELHVFTQSTFIYLLKYSAKH
jgi:hypothetical protein